MAGGAHHVLGVLIDTMLRLTLRAKLLLGVILILLPVLGATIYTYRVEYALRQGQVLDQLASSAESIGLLVDAAFDEAVAVGQAIAQDRDIQSLDPARVQARLLEFALVYPQYDNLSVWDVSGNNVASVVPTPPGVNIADRPFFQRLLATGAPQVSELVLGRVVGRPVVIVQVPILGPDRRVRGALAITIEVIDPLQRSLAGVHLLPDQTVMIFDSTGRLVHSTDAVELSWEERDLSYLPEVQEALAGRVVRTADFRSPLHTDVRAAAFVPTLRYRWIVAVTWPVAAALGPVEQIFRLELLALAAIALLATIGALLLANFLISPIERLAAEARAIGRGELERRVEIKTGDELEDLGQAFNSMAERVQSTLREIEAARREAERERDLARAVIENAPLAILVTQGPEHRVVVANQIALALLGQPAEALLQRSLTELPLPELTALILPVIERVYRNARAEFIPELELRLPGERVVYAHVAFAPLPGPGGVPQGVVVLAVDITEPVRARRRIEELVQELGRANAHLLAVLDAVESAIILVDKQGMVIVANRRVSDFFGLAPTDIVRTKRLDEVAAAVAPLFKDGEQYLNRVRWLLEHPTEVARGELEQIAPVRRVYSWYSAPVYQDHSFLGRIDVFHDITREREAARLRDEFMFLVSHELRTPLTVVLGGTELALRWLKRRQPMTEKLLRELEDVERSALRLRDMVEQLLDVSAMAAGRLLLRKKKVSLNQLVREELDALAEVLARHRVLVQLPEEELLAEVDPERLRQVIGNLLSNAAKYSPPGTRIWVRLERRDREAVFSVRDEGPGIAPEELPKLFSLFHRIRAPVGPWTEGLGLGLYISKGLIEAHGGRIWVESQPGKGSTFYFTVPLVDRLDTSETNQQV